MAKQINKGLDFNNVNETWNKNEQNRPVGNPQQTSTERSESTGRADLDRVIKKEAKEYDTTNKEDQLLSGDRATINDDDRTDES